MPLYAVIASQLPAAVGVIAASMAIGAFLSQARSALDGASEVELRQKAVIGGIFGLVGGSVVAVLSVTLPI